jgi:hypothetical protein
MSTFAFIKPQNGLWKDAKIAKVQTQILERITSLPEAVRKDKFNMELLLMICLMVEHKIDNQGKKDKMKIDKKLVAVQILTSLFGQMNPVELKTITDHIEYLHDNGAIIKYPWYKTMSSIIGDWFKKKLA